VASATDNPTMTSLVINVHVHAVPTYVYHCGQLLDLSKTWAEHCYCGIFPASCILMEGTM